MAKPSGAVSTADGAPIPIQLKLEFSKAADNQRISTIFDQAVKSKIDPQNYVVKREEDIFDDAIDEGRAAFLYDPDTGEVHTITMAYLVHDDDDHAFTEIGSSLTRVVGYKSAQVVIAALVLNEWLNNEPSDMVVTEILPGNGPSLHLYRDKMGWEQITEKDTTDKLHKLCNEFISIQDQGRPTEWFSCSDTVLPKMAKILIDYLDDGELYNKHENNSIDLNLDVLDQTGLDRPFLERIANGQLDKAGPAVSGPSLSP